MTGINPASQPEVWHVGAAAIARLKDLGLTEADLTEPLELALADARLCTALDAPGAQGYMFWTRANRYLRERLAPQEWGWTNRDSILRTIDPQMRFTVTALSGAGSVGMENGSVRTKNPKGSAVATLVRYNYSVYGGPLNYETLPGMEQPIPEFEPHMLPTWFLLYRWTTGGVVRELSLPSDMLGSVVNRWREHIILDGSIGGEGGSVNLDIFNNGPDDDGPDVAVERVA